MAIPMDIAYDNMAYEISFCYQAFVNPEDAIGDRNLIIFYVRKNDYPYTKLTTEVALGI